MFNANNNVRTYEYTYTFYVYIWYIHSNNDTYTFIDLNKITMNCDIYLVMHRLHNKILLIFMPHKFRIILRV